MRRTGVQLAGALACLMAAMAVPALAESPPGDGTVVLAGSAHQSATVGTRYLRPLQVQVVGADGTALKGVSVTFALGTATATGAGEGAAGATFAGGATQATALTDATGHAVSPRLTATATAGRFSATAALAGDGDGKKVVFALRNLAGKPATITPGVGSSESAATGSRFPVRLAVTVTDAGKNPVPGALVTFSAPVRGPGGSFAPGSRRSARVRTDAAGVAVAPVFIASGRQGGYVVRATAAGARPAVFALVNDAPRA